MNRRFGTAVCALVALSLSGGILRAQTQASAKADLGSNTAKNGFRNEDEIAAKFNNWRTDAEAKTWLAALGVKDRGAIRSVTTSKPHGEKADIVVKIVTPGGEQREGISIKLVSSDNGFNQIDKRWVAHYATLWKIPGDVKKTLELFVGDQKPAKAGRDPQRIYLDEVDPSAQNKVIAFFTDNKGTIVSDLLRGHGEYRADWILVALKSGTQPRWILRKMDYAIRYFGDGPVTVTNRGNLKIGRITMQRKGGDGGRDSARMLQFKINPALLFEGN